MTRSSARGTAPAPFHARYVTILKPERIDLDDRVEILTVVEGHGCYEQVLESGEVSESRLDRGQVVAIRPSDKVTLWSRHESGMRAVSVAVSYLDWVEFVLFAGEGELLTPAREPRGRRIRPIASPALSVFEGALARSRSVPSRRDLARFLAATVDLLASERPRTASAPAVPSWLADAIRELRLEHNLRAGVPRLAELSRVSRAHLADTTRRLLGITPTGLVAEARLRHAQNLLETTETTIAEISRRCGYASSASFSTMFRTRTSLTPREYRARSRRGWPAAPDLKP